MYCFRANNKAILDNQVDLLRGIAISKQLPLSLQVFTVNGEYIYRLLSDGYAYENYLWKLPLTFPPCNYDNRADLPDEDIPNEAIALIIDELITSETYDIIPICYGIN